MKKSKTMIMAAAVALSGAAAFAAVGAKDAEAMAISHSGVESARFVHTERDRDDGRSIWDVSFYDGDREYSYDIDAETGDIIKADWELDWWDRAGDVISEEDALYMALDDAGVNEADAGYLRVHAERDDGDIIYKVRFSDASSRYEYDIADNGTIVSKSVEAESRGNGSSIDIKEAGRIALSLVDGATEDDMRIRQDSDDGRVTYEGSIYLDGFEYEFEIDGRSGRVIDFERDREWR